MPVMLSSGHGVGTRCRRAAGLDVGVDATATRTVRCSGWPKPSPRPPAASGWNGSRVLSAVTTGAGRRHRRHLRRSRRLGRDRGRRRGFATGPLALLSLEPLFFRTRKYSGRDDHDAGQHGEHDLGTFVQRHQRVAGTVLARHECSWSDQWPLVPVAVLEFVPAVAVVCTSTRPVKLAVMMSGARLDELLDEDDELEWCPPSSRSR